MMTTEKEDKILSYLQEKLAMGKEYFKSKYIAKETGLSPKQVGTTLFNLSQKQDILGLEIKQYSVAISTTWRIRLV